MDKFARRLRTLREGLGFSQQRLADEIGTSKSSINMYERGEREPGFETLEAIADIFNVSFDYLLGKTDVRWSISDKTGIVNGDKEKPKLSQDESVLIGNYNTLNPSGKEEAQKRVSELAEIPRYTNADDSTDTTLAIAALGGDGVKFKNIPVRDKEDVLGILKKRKEKENNK